MLESATRSWPVVMQIPCDFPPLFVLRMQELAREAPQLIFRPFALTSVDQRPHKLYEFAGGFEHRDASAVKVLYGAVRH
jgi:hypothetical protein